MAEPDSAALKPLTAVDGKPAFEEPWQAEALAMADTLVQNGLFSARAWSDSLGAALASAAASGAADTQETYYGCVVKALETLIAANTDINESAMAETRKAWKTAYLSTPHGQPVNLKPDG
jgi:nitrile hydratase accessory protein